MHPCHVILGRAVPSAGSVVCVCGSVVTSGMWCVQVWKAGTRECGVMVLN